MNNVHTIIYLRLCISGSGVNLVIEVRELGMIQYRMAWWNIHEKCCNVYNTQQVIWQQQMQIHVSR